MIYIINFLFSVGLFARIIFLKVCYMKHDAICLEMTPGSNAYVTHAIYEYELTEKGKKVIYKSKGTNFLYPRKVKRYKVLISKKNHNKVVGYAHYILILCMGCVCFAVATIGLIGFLSGYYVL